MDPPNNVLRSEWPKSPRDTTPLLVNGSVVDKNKLTKIGTFSAARKYPMSPTIATPQLKIKGKAKKVDVHTEGNTTPRQNNDIRIKSPVLIKTKTSNNTRISYGEKPTFPTFPTKRINNIKFVNDHQPALRNFDSDEEDNQTDTMNHENPNIEADPDDIINLDDRDTDIDPDDTINDENTEIDIDPDDTINHEDQDNDLDVDDIMPLNTRNDRYDNQEGIIPLDSDDTEDIEPFDLYQSENTSNINPVRATSPVIPRRGLIVDKELISPLSPNNDERYFREERRTTISPKKQKPIVISPPVRSPKPSSPVYSPVAPSPIYSSRPPPEEEPPDTKVHRNIYEEPEGFRSPRPYRTQVQPQQKEHIELPKQYIPMATDVRYAHNPIHDTRIDSQIPNYSAMTEGQRTDRLDEFRINFNILRKTYPDIPTTIEDIDPKNLVMLFRRYKRYVKQLDKDYTAEQYKMMLIFYFIVLDLIATNFFGSSGGKFTMTQIKWLPIYQQSLTELSEEHPGGISTGWPPMVKLAVYGMVNLVIFVVLNYFLARFGPDITEKIHSAIFNVFAHGNMGGQGVGSVGSDGSLPPPPDNGSGLFGNIDISTLISGLGSMMGGNKSQESRKDTRRGPRYTE